MPAFTDLQDSPYPGFLVLSEDVHAAIHRIIHIILNHISSGYTPAGRINGGTHQRIIGRFRGGGIITIVGTAAGIAPGMDQPQPMPDLVGGGAT
ncbi:hypothetical protein D9M69_604630 [compost metagenome]